jgi:hypothetical protein
VTRPVTLGLALNRQVDQSIHQGGIGYSGGLPQLGIHADLGESRDGVELVQIELFCIFVEEEVDACREASMALKARPAPARYDVLDSGAG